MYFHFAVYRSCPWKPAPCGWDQLNTGSPNPHVLSGGLVGGPGDLNGNFVDDRKQYKFTEVACDYNSGLVGALAGITYIIVDHLEKCLHKRVTFIDFLQVWYIFQFKNHDLLSEMYHVTSVPFMFKFFHKKWPLTIFNFI